MKTVQIRWWSTTIDLTRTTAINVPLRAQRYSWVHCFPIHEVIRPAFAIRPITIWPIAGWVVIAPPIRFSVVDFSRNRRNHVKVSTSLGLLLAHLGFLGRPVDLLREERYTTCSSLFPPCVFFYVCTQTQMEIHISMHITRWPSSFLNGKRSFSH